MWVIFVGAVSLLIVAVALEKLWRVAKSVIYWTTAAALCVALGVVTTVLTQAMTRQDPTAMLTSASPWLGFAAAAGTFLLLVASRRHDTAGPRMLARVEVKPNSRHALRPLTAVRRQRRPTLRQALSYWSRVERHARTQAREDACRAAAWDKLQTAVDWAPSEIAVARRSCETFLAASDGSVDFTVLSFSVALRKRIPEIVDEVCKSCAGASSSERRAMLEETIDNVQRLGTEADRLKRTLTLQVQSRLAVTRAYVETVTGRQEPAAF